MQEMFYMVLLKKIKFTPEGWQGRNITINGYKIAENIVFSKALHQKASRKQLWVQKSHIPFKSYP